MTRLAFASLLAGATLWVGCGKPPGSSATMPTPGAASPAAADGKLHDGPPLATPGEHMQYSLALKGIELAVYDLSIGDVSEVAGKQAVVVQGHAKSIGIASVLTSIDDHFTSWVDVSTGHALRFQTDELASGGSDVEHTVVELAARDGAQIPVSFHLNDAAPTAEAQHATLPVAWDYNTFMIALRGWEGPPGAKLDLEVFRSRWMWHVEVTIAGKESLVTKLGDYPALRITGRTYKLDRKGARVASSEERQFTLWISDDDGRVPLKISAVTDYGALEMAIADYQPGNAARLRP